MPNAGYPDDDGSRTPSGQHDLGRQRESCYDVASMMTPATIADHLNGRFPVNNRTDSSGDLPAPNDRWAVDGNSNSRGNFTPAAYPPKPEDPNSQD